MTVHLFKAQGFLKSPRRALMKGDRNPPTAPQTPAAEPAPPRLLEQLRQTARQRGHSEPAVAAFADWSRRFILFHGKRHPRELGVPEVGQFLESTAQTARDPVRPFAASRDAVDFLYREVLH